jgi:hypothetical protein
LLIVKTNGSNLSNDAAHVREALSRAEFLEFQQEM